MKTTQNRLMVLALGNDIMGDDGAALAAAKVLRDEFGNEVDIFEVASAGFMLLDLLEGYDKVIIIDTILSTHSPGLIRELTVKELSCRLTSSPHYAGLPEIIGLAKKLELNFPDEVRILVMEIEDPFIIRQGLSPNIERKIPDLVKKVKDIIFDWQKTVTLKNFELTI
ncbi:MAG: hydrogenase maturation protease [Ignavibacteria bacterium]|nr:hydrogenase maturation protease [Ignavibacteria bacterium]